MNQPLHILHLEDQPEDTELAEATLDGEGVAVRMTRVETRADFMRALDDGGFDLILADYALPAFDGMTALELAQGRRPDVPFVFFSGALQDDTAVEALRRGAADFVVKQRLVRLAPAVRRALREARERADRRRAEASLKFLLDASAFLASTLDVRASLGNVARLAASRFADWCVIDLAGDDPGDPIAAAHSDRARIAAILDLRRRYPVEPGAPSGLAAVLRTGRPELHADVAELDLLAEARGNEHLAALRALGTVSRMIVPMVANERTLGAITFVLGPGERRYDGRDLDTARSLAERAAVAVENARLYRRVHEAVRMREDIIAVVSHDLRNPLSAVATAASLLQAEVAPGSRSQRWIDTITRSVRGMSRLISDLLDLAKIQSGTLELDVERHDVLAIAGEAIEMLLPLAQQKGLTLSCDVEDGLTATVDRDRVLQVLSNLVGNAVKFTPAGGSITVRGVRAGAGIALAVRDTGSGIPPEQVSRIFDRYWQAHPRGRGGVGLGLSIVKGIVEAHRGRIEVDSRLGDGSEFRAFFPDAMPAAAARSVPPDESSLPAPNIMVVDDDHDIRAAVSDLLRDRGYSVIAAANGREALDLLQSRGIRPLVILLDVMMPVMDGVEFRAAQQLDPELRLIPVVVFSAHGEITDVADRLHAVAHLKKPFHEASLLETIDRVVHVVH